jgi:sulfoxide reductase heme-binding subunit YedZ
MDEGTRVSDLPRSRLGVLIWDAFTGGLGSNPTQFLEHATGDWTLRFVAITLGRYPVAQNSPPAPIDSLPAHAGSFRVFYGCCHFSVYLTFDQVFDLHGIWADVVKRRYITVGFAGFVLMIPLAVTSTAGMIRRLGGKRWALLHRAIYLTAIAGVIHYYWLVKSDVHLPLEYAAVMAVLLGWRVYDHYSKTPRRAPASIPARKEQTSAAPD